MLDREQTKHATHLFKESSEYLVPLALNLPQFINLKKMQQKLKQIPLFKTGFGAAMVAMYLKLIEPSGMQIN